MKPIAFFYKESVFLGILFLKRLIFNKKSHW